MRILSVETCGFRGFLEKARFDFGSGFTVICGRNGVGKSTIFDAIEFALTGSINKYVVEKAAGEGLNDYYWWRGAGKPQAHYVTVIFVDELGKTFSITRSREAGSDKSTSEIEAALCLEACPENAALQLCKTSIIRDELIAALSLDLTEVERFDLVRAALGPIEHTDLSGRAREILAAAEAIHRKNEANYSQARVQLTSELTQLSEAKDVVARSTDMTPSLEVLASIVPNDGRDLMVRISLGRTYLAAMRNRVSIGFEALFQGRELEIVQNQVLSESAEQTRKDFAESVRKSAEVLQIAELQFLQATEAFNVQKEASDIAASLSALVTHGEELGLNGEHCPLCAAQRTMPEFAAGLDLARQRISDLSSGLNAAQQALSKTRSEFDAATSALATARDTNDEAQKQLEALRLREKAHVELFEKSGYSLAFINDLSAFERQLSEDREGLINIERAIQTLQASTSISRVMALEERMDRRRVENDALADMVLASDNALRHAKNIDRTVRRVSGEIIDERLAQISPLLNEIYQRLSPHPDWKSIDYGIRGDVKRYLSLKVGDGLNPQFVFSSGQRRAAGLAFLLSVHLSRAWARWSTLLLDDPVQHIDDFRALQLAEVLGAIRSDGRQVVVAVEDAALADLLVRRLGSRADQGGVRFDIDRSDQCGSAVISQRVIPPLASGLFKPGVGQVAAS